MELPIVPSSQVEASVKKDTLAALTGSHRIRWMDRHLILDPPLSPTRSGADCAPTSGRIRSLCEAPRHRAWPLPIASAALFLLLLLGACSSHPPAASRAEPSLLGRATSAETSSASEISEDPSLPDRWRAPFAVTSNGRPAPHELHPAVIIGIDPALEPGLEAVHGREVKDLFESR